MLVEDNGAGILLTKKAFEGSRMVDKLSVLKDGKAPIDFLARQGKYSPETLPYLLLPDINLPRKTV